MEDPKPGHSAPGSAETQSSFWDMFDGLIDRILREDLYVRPHQTKSNTECSSLSLPSSHREELSRHHQRVSKRICLSKQTYPTLSPYVQRHKIISQLMDFHEPKRPVVKCSSRRLRKLRAKPLLDISDWGLSDDSVSEDDVQNDHVIEVTDNLPDIEQKECRINETTPGIQFVQSAFCDPQGEADERTDTSPSRQGHCQGRKDTGELASLSKCDEMDTYNSPNDSVMSKEVLSLDGFVKNSSVVKTKEIDPNFDNAHALASTSDSRTFYKTGHESYRNTNNVHGKIDETHRSSIFNNSIDDAIRETTGLKKEYERFIDKTQTEKNLQFVDGYHVAKHTTNVISTRDKLDKSINPSEAVTEQGDWYSGMVSNMASHQSSEGSEGADPDNDLDRNMHSDALSSSYHGESPTCSTVLSDLHNPKSTISEHRPLSNNLSSTGNNSKNLTDHSVLEQRDVSQDGEKKKDIVNIGEIDDAEIESILATLLRAQKNFKNVVPSIDQEEYQRKLATYMERKKEHNPEGNVSEDDARKVVLLEHIIRFFERKIVEIVKFAKCVPGFKDLCMDDQAALIKVSRTECGMVGGVPMVNTRDRVIHAENNYTLPLQLLGTVVSPRFMSEFFKLCKKIESANIKEKEGALLRGITITFTDRCKLKEPEKVQTIQNKLVTCLIHVIKEETTSVSPQVRLGQLFEILTCVRNYTDVDSNLLRDTLLEYPNYSGNDLVKEFLDRSQIV